jgi:hypothetical protein
MSTRGISRVIAHQMNTIGGPVDFDELQRQFPATTREQLERAVCRWADREADKKLLRYGEHQVGLMCELASVLEDFASDEEYSATITDLQEVAERAVACRIPISVGVAEAVRKLTGSVVRGETYGFAASVLMVWIVTSEGAVRR